MITFEDGPLLRRLDLHRDWRYDIPLKFLWAVYIYPRAGTLNNLGTNISKAIAKYDKFNNQEWPVDIGCLEQISDPFQNYGLLLAQNAALPSDAFDIANTSIDGAGGYLGGQYANQRLGYGGSNKIDITFLETNIDIFDYFFRPWIIANSYKGLIEDGIPEEDLKCTIQLVQFTRDYESYGINKTYTSKPSIRKVLVFNDAVPFQVSGDSLSYGDLGANDLLKTVSFSFNRYTTINQTDPRIITNV